MTKRRVPRWSDLRPYIRFAPLGGSRTDRRLAHAASIGDLREAARRRTPRAVFDYVDGAAEEERSLRRSREAFAAIEFRPRVLRDVSATSTQTTVLGRPAAMPLVFGPTGFTRLMHHEGEIAVASVAARVGIPYALSTMGTTSAEDLARAVPNGERWFQLYVWRGRSISRELVARAWAAGFRALVLTVDTPVAGGRFRDLRSGFTIPPTLSVRTIADIARHPEWWFNLLTTEPLRFATPPGFHGTVAELVNRMFNPALTLADVDWLRTEWPGDLVIKGIQSPEDARRVVEHGADAIVVSNHGGRQLDRAPTPLESLPSIIDAVAGRAEVFIDGGIMSGADVIAAVAMGARACLVGRAYLYGLMAGGEKGVARVAELMRRDMRRTMQLLGISTIDELAPDQVRFRWPPGAPDPGPTAVPLAGTLAQGS